MDISRKLLEEIRSIIDQAINHALHTGVDASGMRKVLNDLTQAKLRAEPKEDEKIRRVPFDTATDCINSDGTKGE